MIQSAILLFKIRDPEFLLIYLRIFNTWL